MVNIYFVGLFSNNYIYAVLDKKKYMLSGLGMGRYEILTV